MPLKAVGVKELVGSNEPERNWRGILIAILVILIVLSLIVVAVILVTPKDSSRVLGEPFSFHDLFDPDNQPLKFNAKWIGERNIYVYRNRQGELMEYNADHNTTQFIMDNSTFRELNTDYWEMSEDLQYVLIAFDKRHTFRHSFSASYTIYNRFASNPKEKLIPFPQSVATQGADNWRDKYLQYAGWSRTGSSLTFIYENNLYYQSDPFTTPTQVTQTGVVGLVYNGLPDWLYEEEILKSNSAHWWSPNGEFIVYAKIDDRQLPLYEFQRFGEGTNIYGDIDGLPYPKAGDLRERVLPIVQLYLVSTVDSRAPHKELQAPDFRGQEYYLTNVTWQDNSHLLVSWINRAQNWSINILCDARDAVCYFNTEDYSKGGTGWVDYPSIRFIERGQTYLTIKPGQDGTSGFWKHIAMVTAPVGIPGVKTFITQGTWDVTQIVGFNEETKTVYFISTNMDPRRRHLFSVTIPDRDVAIPSPQCITCHFPDDCQYVSATFSHSGKYYILNCQGPGIPTYTLYSAETGGEIMLEDNHEFASRIGKKALPPIEYYEVETEDGESIWVKVLLPPVLNKDHITLYPVLVHVYGGPGSQMVTEQFRVGWETYLTSTEKIICVFVDGRGSGGRGDRFLHSIYRKLGTVEVQDTIAGGRFVRDSFSFIDAERVAIWGWSFGGFVAAHAVGDPDSVFTCGISVAPVTDWRYYDTAYAERYMGLANSNDNYRGYDNANVSRKASHFKGKDFMLIHGTADDNVHFQHSAQLAKALTAADVDFRIHVYTDKNHGLSGSHTRHHLYKMMTNHLKQYCWKGGKPRQLKGGAMEDVLEQ